MATCSAATPNRPGRVAILDALWQRADDARRRRGQRAGAHRRAACGARARRPRAETAATRVDFFTLVRGEDAA